MSGRVLISSANKCFQHRKTLTCQWQQDMGSNSVNADGLALSDTKIHEANIRPRWSPSGAARAQLGGMLAIQTLLSGLLGTRASAESVMAICVPEIYRTSYWLSAVYGCTYNLSIWYDKSCVRINYYFSQFTLHYDAIFPQCYLH